MLIKTKRKISWEIYVVAFVITAVVFGAGVFVGIQIESSIRSGIVAGIEEMQGRIITIETMLLSEESLPFCNFFIEEIEKFDRETFELGQKIGYMEERKGIDPALKAKYMFLELRDYLLIKKADRICNKSTNTILYFLSSFECEKCMEQGKELTKTRERFGVRVYSFDVDVNSTIVNALKEKYNIEKFPTIIVNGKVYEGFTSSDELETLLR